jgi:hypothetical protein
MSWSSQILNGNFAEDCKPLKYIRDDCETIHNMLCDSLDSFASSGMQHADQGGRIVFMHPSHMVPAEYYNTMKKSAKKRGYAYFYKNGQQRLAKYVDGELWHFRGDKKLGKLYPMKTLTSNTTCNEKCHCHRDHESCNMCGQRETSCFVRFQQCPCHTVYYCSKVCQKKH